VSAQHRQLSSNNQSGHKAQHQSFHHASGNRRSWGNSNYGSGGSQKYSNHGASNWQSNKKACVVFILVYMHCTVCCFQAKWS